MFKCEITDFYDIEDIDKWQEDINSPFGIGSNIRWAVEVCFLIKVMDTKPGLFKRRQEIYGDEIHALICSPAFEKKPNMESFDTTKAPIVMREFSEKKAKARINEILSRIEAESVESLFSEIKKTFDIESS